jgi:hypothetical protein
MKERRRKERTALSLHFYLRGEQLKGEGSQTTEPLAASFISNKAAAAFFAGAELKRDIKRQSDKFFKARREQCPFVASRSVKLRKSGRNTVFS